MRRAPGTAYSAGGGGKGAVGQSLLGWRRRRRSIAPFTTLAASWRRGRRPIASLATLVPAPFRPRRTEVLEFNPRDIAVAIGVNIFEAGPWGRHHALWSTHGPASPALPRTKAFTRSPALSRSLSRSTAHAGALSRFTLGALALTLFRTGTEALAWPASLWTMPSSFGKTAARPAAFKTSPFRRWSRTIPIALAAAESAPLSRARLPVFGRGWGGWRGAFHLRHGSRGRGRRRGGNQILPKRLRARQGPRGAKQHRNC